MSIERGDTKMKLLADGNFSSTFGAVGVSSEPGPYLMYCSDLLYFLARYLAEALLGILTKDSSLL